MDKFTAAANLGMFLTETAGKPTGQWVGRMAANKQRELFGAFLGKGELDINGENETVVYTVVKDYSRDYESAIIPWAKLPSRKEIRL